MSTKGSVDATVKIADTLTSAIEAELTLAGLTATTTQFQAGKKVIAQNTSAQSLDMGGVTTAKLVSIKSVKSSTGAPQSIRVSLTYTGPTTVLLPPSTEFLLSTSENEDIIGIKITTQAAAGDTTIEYLIGG